MTNKRIILIISILALVLLLLRHNKLLFFGACLLIICTCIYMVLKKSGKLSSKEMFDISKKELFDVFNLKKHIVNISGKKILKKTARKKKNENK